MKTIDWEYILKSAERRYVSTRYDAHEAYRINDEHPSPLNRTALKDAWRLYRKAEKTWIALQLSFQKTP